MSAQPLTWSALKQVNPPAPGDVSAFNRDLTLASRDRGIELRCVWGPDQTKCILNGQIYKRYGLTAGPIRILQGHQIRNHFGKVVGYEHLDGRVVGLNKGLRAPDYKREQPAIERWIIEQRIPDAVARRQWEKVRYANVDGEPGYRCAMCDHEWLYDGRRQCPRCTSHAIEGMLVGPRKIDALGEFPKEGYWKAFLIIGVHAPDKSCCTELERRLKVCIGSAPRMPDQRDLDEVRASLKDRDTWPILRNLEEPPTAREIELGARALQAELEKSYLKMWGGVDPDSGEEVVGSIGKEVGEEIAPLISALDSPKFDIGAAYRRASDNLKRLAAKLRG